MSTLFFWFLDNIIKPLKTTIPCGPGNPGSPSRPSSPSGPCSPGKPRTPLGPVTSTPIPGRPGSPKSPGSPGKPLNPGRPSIPGRPDNPAGPTTVTPGWPFSPFNPSGPGKPGVPGNPSSPDWPRIINWNLHFVLIYGKSCLKNMKWKFKYFHNGKEPDWWTFLESLKMFSVIFTTLKVQKLCFKIWHLKPSCLNWAASWQNQQYGMCAQRRLRSAWASVQSDQSSLSAWRKLGPWATHWAQSEDSDQTGRMPRLIGVFAGHIVILLFLSCGGSIVMTLTK